MRAALSARGIARRIVPVLGLGVLLALPAACDRSSSSSSDEDVETNFGVGLSSVISMHGVPDSVVVAVSVDGVPDTFRVDPAQRDVGGVVRFPVDARDGASIVLSYRVFKSGEPVASGTRSWTSGASVSVPRPDLAPLVRLSRGGLVARSGGVLALVASSIDSEGRLAALLVDRDGDGAADDSIVPPSGKDTIRLSWDKAGDYRVTAWIRDEPGLRSRDTATVRVLPKARVAISMDTTASVGDSVEILVSMSYETASQADGTRLVWSVDGVGDTTPMLQSRRFSWSSAGRHVVVVSAIDAAGEASRDTMAATVVLDAPRIDLGAFPKVVNVGAVTTLPVSTSQAFGTIVRWGVDFDGDTTGGWDTIGTGPVGGVQHLFGRFQTAPLRILAFVEDDDGNRTLDSALVSLGTSTVGALLLRESRKDTTVSVGDSSVMSFERSFPDGLEERCRVEWKVDGAVLDTTAVLLRRAFHWTASGAHKVAWRLLTPIGSTFPDEVSVTAALDAPEVVLDPSSFPASVDRDAFAAFRVSASQSFGTVARWGMDFDGDTARGWDTVLAGAPSALLHVFPATGSTRVLVFVEDDDGNRTVASRSVDVVAGVAALRRSSPASQEASIRDTLAARLVESFPAAMRAGSRLEWRVDAQPAETLALDTVRRFVWNEPGRHVVRFRALTPAGATSLDSAVFDVVQGRPVVRAIVRSGSGVGQAIVFQVVSDPMHGSIVAERWDFGNDGVWDDSSAIAGSEVRHVFLKSAPTAVRVQVQDDDGNKTDSVYTFRPSNGSPVFQSAGFDAASAGVRIPASLAVSFGDPDGAADLADLSVDWDGDGAWDTARSVTGMQTSRFQHAWTTPGARKVRLRLRDASGDSAFDTVAFQVDLDAPRIVALTVANGSVARVGDTVWYSASIEDPSVPYDLDSAFLHRDGMPDQGISLRGRSTLDLPVPVASRALGVHAFRVVVRDLVGNTDTARGTWTVVAAPPLVMASLPDSILVSGASARLVLDSLVSGERGGTIVSAAWSYKGSSTWTAIPAPSQGDEVKLTLPVFSPARRDSAWYVVVRVVQDDGETVYDTVRADLLESFVDARNWIRYPVTTIGGTKWMARNLAWTPLALDSVSATCPTGEDCLENGFRYGAPRRLAGQWSDPRSNRMVSVCPDGWRLPSADDWERLEASALAAKPGDGSASRLLRSRTGWHYLESPQLDPLRFSATPSSVRGFAEVSDWWSYDSSGVGHASLMSTFLDVAKPADAGPYHVRCVRNTEILIDSGWRRSGQARRIDGGVYMYVRAIVPDSAATVTVRIVADGGVSEATSPPAGLLSGNGFSGLRVPLPMPSKPGRQVFRLEIEQLGVKAVDSMVFVALLPVDGGPNGVTRVGDQVWSANDVMVDDVVDYGDANHFGYHYALDTLFGGTAPDAGSAAPVRGICPTGMHIPSPAEWNRMFAAIQAEGFDPQTTLRIPMQDWANLWPSLAKPENRYGFSAEPQGRRELGTWKDGSYYWAVDGSGYSLVAIVSATGAFETIPPVHRGDAAGMAAALRCVGD